VSCELEVKLEMKRPRMPAGYLPSACSYPTQRGAFQNTQLWSACCVRSPEVPNHIGTPHARSSRGIIARVLGNDSAVYSLNAPANPSGRSASSAWLNDAYAPVSCGCATLIQ